MLSWIIGGLLIVVGFVGAVMVWLAAGMSDARVDTWSDIGKPMIWLAAAVLLGIGIIVFR